MTFTTRVCATVTGLFIKERDIAVYAPSVMFKVVSWTVEACLPKFSFSPELPLAAKADIAVGMPVVVVHLIRGETGTRVVMFFC